MGIPNSFVFVGLGLRLPASPPGSTRPWVPGSLAPTDLRSLLQKPVDAAAQLLEDRSEEGAPRQDAVCCFTQQSGLHLTRAHTRACGVKVRGVLLQPFTCQPAQRRRGDGMRCSSRGRVHPEEEDWLLLSERGNRGVGKSWTTQTETNISSKYHRQGQKHRSKSTK